MLKVSAALFLQKDEETFGMQKLAKALDRDR